MQGVPFFFVLRHRICGGSKPDGISRLSTHGSKVKQNSDAILSASVVTYGVGLCTHSIAVILEAVHHFILLCSDLKRK